MAKPVTHTVDFLSAAEEDLHRYTNCHYFIHVHLIGKPVVGRGYI